jgi:hypothetical protein
MSDRQPALAGMSYKRSHLTDVGQTLDEKLT